MLYLLPIADFFILLLLAYKLSKPILISHAVFLFLGLSMYACFVYFLEKIGLKFLVWIVLQPIIIEIVDGCIILIFGSKEDFLEMLQSM